MLPGGNVPFVMPTRTDDDDPFEERGADESVASYVNEAGSIIFGGVT